MTTSSAPVVTPAAAPRIGGGSDDTAWVGGSNVVKERRTRPESTLARRPTEFKSAASIESKATEGLPEDRRLSLDEKTSKITLTSWVNAIRSYMETHGLDTVFRIYDSATDSEVYLLQDWGSSDTFKVATWEQTLLAGIANLPVCEYDVDNLKWSGRAIMNSISLDLWETIEKDVGVGANGPVTYAAVISKIQQVSASSVRSLVDKLKKMHLLQEPGQDVEIFGSRVIEMTRRIQGSGLAPTDLTSIVASCFIDCDVLAFKLKALSFFDLVDDDATAMTWEDIVRQLKQKYRSLLGQELWDPQKKMKPADTSVLDGLQASINKLAAQVTAGTVKPPPSSGGRTLRCYDCGQPGHVRNDCPNKGTPASKSFPPSEGAPHIRQVNGVSETWCATCKHWTTGNREHSTTTHVRRPSPRGGAPPASPPPAVATPPVVAPVVAAAASLAGVASVAEVDSPYTGGRLTLFHDGLFVGQLCGRDAPSVTSDFLLADPSLCIDDLFHSDAVRLSLSSSAVEETFHDAVSELVGVDVISIEEATDDEKANEEVEKAIDDAVLAGRCPNCHGVGWLGNLCELCEDSGMVYEFYDSEDDHKPIEPVAELMYEFYDSEEDEFYDSDDSEEDDNQAIEPIFEVEEEIDKKPIASSVPGDNVTSAVKSLFYLQTFLFFAYLFATSHHDGPIYIFLTLGQLFLIRQESSTSPIKSKLRYSPSFPFAYPASDLILSAYMLSASFVGFLLSMSGFYPSVVYSPALPAKLENVYELHQFLPKRSKLSPGRRILRLGLLAAISMADSIPNIELLQDKSLKHDLRRHRGSHGYLMTANLRTDAIERLRVVLEASKVHLLHDDDYFELIMDTGCSKICTGHVSDFVKGSLVDLPDPIRMDGIAGLLMSHQKGKVRYEVINDVGGLSVLECEAYYLPNLKFRLFSPQVYLRQRAESQGELKGDYCLKWDSSVLRLENGDNLTIGYHHQTALPVFRAFTNAMKTAQSLSAITSSSNSNLTSHQKHLYSWHTRWGHLGFQHCQWLGRTGIVGPGGIKMGSTTVTPPKCDSCQLGKQERTSKAGTKTISTPDGYLKLNKLEPGDLVFSDQYESRLEGRQFTARGHSLSSQKYRGGTLFCDAASGKVSVIHQVGLTGTETVQAKLQFEREAASVGVSVLDYCTDNGIYTSKEFSSELLVKGQGIKHSGVGGHHQNGVAENCIKTTVRTARTMMIHSALRWPEHNERDLWPLAFSHAAHLHNETPHMLTRLSPNEIWSRSKSTHSALINAHPWGCPVYVLQPRLQDGGKLPKWEPRSRRGQYMGASPLHASTVGLIRNLNTHHISPQFHCVYDNGFDTVHSIEGEPPAEWPDMFVFNRFRSDYDDSDFVPELSDEWLTPVEVAARQQLERSQRQAADPQDGRIPSDREPPDSQRAPDSSDRNSDSLQRAPPQRAPTPVLDPITDNDPPFVDSLMEEPEPDPGPPALRRSTRRTRNPNPSYAQHGSLIVRSYCASMVSALFLTSGQAYDNRYLLNLLLDRDFGLYDNLLANTLLCHPHAMKASTTPDPDSPRLHEAMSGEHREEFLAAMSKEIEELESHGTWTVIKKSSLPRGANLLPSTWAFKIKRYPDGRMRKHKARFCCRGDKQIAGVDFFESYAPVVAWSTVRMVMNIAIQQGWASRQVDFSNAFVQATLEEEVYLEMPAMFADETLLGDEATVLKLNKSLYGLVQAPRSWYQHLQKGLDDLDFKPSPLDPAMYYGRGMILITYVDDTLFFGPDIKAIEKVISDLELAGYALTREDGDEATVFSFLGVSLTPNQATKMVTLTQTGLIDKILEASGMTDCNVRGSPSTTNGLGTDANGARRKEKWNYASIIGMMMYLSSNAHPEIQFAVHQCARFTHCPRASHEEAVKHICRYLKGAKGHGLTFQPTTNLDLNLYVDADFAGLWNHEDDQDPVCVKSRTGYVLTLGGCPISWSSKLQTEIALSTTEAEFIALSQAMRELIPTRRLLAEICGNMRLQGGSPVSIKSTVFEDNNGAISTAHAVKMTPRTKHIAVKYFFFKSHIGPGTGIELVKIDTLLQKADIFTKGMAPEKFSTMRKLLCGW
jgi:hypothetical protein